LKEGKGKEKIYLSDSFLISEFSGRFLMNKMVDGENTIYSKHGSKIGMR
jgi:hypothetical protein